MSDAGLDPALSDDEADGVATPADNGEEGTPRDTVEDGIDEEVDDLFGDDDDAPA